MSELLNRLQADLNTARKAQVTRQAQDDFAVESHRKAACATEEGAFADEIVAIGEDAADHEHADGAAARGHRRAAVQSCEETA